MAIKISIYEDNASQLERLSHLIRGNGSFELCVASTCVAHIVEETKKWLPDVVLMGIDTLEQSANKSIRQIKAILPQVNVLRFSVFENREKIFDALNAGATGYLLKTTPPLKITEAIEELYYGGSPMSSSIARTVIDFFAKTETGNKPNKYNLTKRECEVLQRFLLGDSYKMIANTFFISMGTVYSHINHIYKKLQVNSKTEAVVKTLEERLV